MMSNATEPSDGSPEDVSGYAYYSFGLSIGVLLLFAFVTFLLYFCTRRNALNTSQHLNHNNRPSFALRSISVVQENSNSSHLYGLDEATLKTYPVLLYSELKRDHKGNSNGGDSGRVAATCSICLGDFGESEWLRELPDCHHLFHRKCIDMWLRMNSSCPLCRTSPLPTPVSTPLVEVAPLARSGAS